MVNIFEWRLDAISLDILTLWFVNPENDIGSGQEQYIFDPFCFNMAAKLQGLIGPGSASKVLQRPNKYVSILKQIIEEIFDCTLL